MAAAEIVVRGNRVTYRKAADAFADLDDFSGDLVTDDARELRGDPSRLDMLDRQSGAAGKHPGHGFARARHRVRHVHPLERRVRALQDHRFHACRSTRAPLNS